VPTVLAAQSPFSSCVVTQCEADAFVFVVIELVMILVEDVDYSPCARELTEIETAFYGLVIQSNQIVAMAKPSTSQFLFG
jgi:hypothetical protein